jgi:succinate-semialdehyde dehydrogenase / glutarate-semialdehyde dehydrogenase
MSSDSDIYKEEFFGPVFNLFKVDNHKDAIDLANKSDYGLASTVFTEDSQKAETCAKRLHTGSVFINSCVVSGSDFPSGGIKGSGYGRECYSDGLYDTANRKTIVRRRDN